MKQASLRSNFLECSVCGLTYAVIPDGSEELLMGKMACTTSGCKGLFKKLAIANKTPTQIPAIDLFLALGGGGLPEEKRLASPRLLKRDFEGAKVVKIDVTQASDTRSFITSMTFSNDKVIHFGGSTKGATIFKVTEVKNGSR